MSIPAMLSIVCAFLFAGGIGASHPGGGRRAPS
jgi:hypothetical protein